MRQESRTTKIVMTIHPIFVHFPIALLIVYSLMELIAWKKISSKNYWFYTKAIILIVGFLGALAALQTGSMDQHNFAKDSPERNIISVHSFWAAVSTYIYGFIVLMYVISWIEKNQIIKTSKSNKLWNLLLKIKSLAIDSWFAIILALAGLTAIAVTGALGGAIVYGPDADPFVSFIYNLFFK